MQGHLTKLFQDMLSQIDGQFSAAYFTDEELNILDSLTAYILKTDPENITAHAWRGDYYNYIQDYKRALPHLEKAYMSGRRDDDTLGNYAVALFHNGAYDCALFLLEPISEKLPNDFFFTFMKAYAYFQLGESEKADAAFQRCIPHLQDLKSAYGAQIQDMIAEKYARDAGPTEP